MRTHSYCVAAASVAALIAAVPAARAQSQNLPMVEIVSTTVSVGVGGQSGNGVLKLPNLAKGCAIPFKVEGFGAGLKVGISKLKAVGAVKNLTKVADIEGKYTAGQAETTVIVGGGVLNMKKENSKVSMELKSSTEGINLGFGAEGMTVKLQKMPVDGPQVDVVYFGYNKHWVGKEGRQTLASLADAWKCRYVKFELVGHTDTTGKEGYNVELSGKRAATVRDYLVKAGINADRITVRAAGENEPLMATGKGKRLRANRAVVVYVR
jgi:outer membrane protein OmpA-like peptidoglycan-associated protein